MAERKDLSECFETLRAETFPSLGMEDPQLIRIVSARLLIERVGERDANYWWDSQVLSEFGRDTLEETVSRTATQSQIELAMKVGRKVENETIGEESVSLFDLGPFVESQLQHEIDKIDNGDGLDILKNKSLEITESGWTEAFVEGSVTVDSGSETASELGSVSVADLQEKEVLDDVVSALISGYSNTTKQDLQIPYYRAKQ